MAALSDSHPAIEKIMIDGYRRMSPAEKLRRVASMNETVLQLAASRIRLEHPGLTEKELRYRLASLWLPPALLEKASRRLLGGLMSR